MVVLHMMASPLPHSTKVSIAQTTAILKTYSTAVGFLFLLHEMDISGDGMSVSTGVNEETQKFYIHGATLKEDNGGHCSKR